MERQTKRKKRGKLTHLSKMDDEQLAEFWDKNEPEDFEGWEKADIQFKRSPKKIIQLRLDPKDLRTIDKESKCSGIDRSQLVRSWVKEKIADLESSA